MKKQYYKVEVRIGFLTSDYGICDSKNVEDLFYYSDGYIVMKETEFEGFLTLDLVKGSIVDKKISFELIDYNNYEYLIFCTQLNTTNTLSQRYYLECPNEQEICAIVDILNKVEDSGEKKKIEAQIINTKKIHKIF